MYSSVEIASTEIVSISVHLENISGLVCLLMHLANKVILILILHLEPG